MIKSYLIIGINNWNQLHYWVLEASEAILGGRDVRKGEILVEIGD
jgi:hypothetical protein